VVAQLLHLILLGLQRLHVWGQDGTPGQHSRVAAAEESDFESQDSAVSFASWHQRPYTHVQHA
jgi:hypothetical protein